MRISDWSSDVCSSDLFQHLFQRAQQLVAFGHGMSGIEGRHVTYQISIPDLFSLQIAIRDPRVASARNRSSHTMLSLATRTEPTGLAGTGIELNDVHSRLNTTRVELGRAHV